MTLTIRNLVLDMDGVLWRGETPFPGLTAFFENLRRLNINFVLATNNATKTVNQYTAKLARFGVQVQAEQILTSSLATAGYLQQQYPAQRTAYVIGEDGVRQALADHGFQILEFDGLPAPEIRAHFVVVGFTRRATYDNLASGALLIRRGARFIGTNPDRTLPSEVGELPGAGSLLAFVEAATGQAPTIIGKPGRILFDAALERLQAKASETTMVGDRLETDIAGAQSAGLSTILLMSGVTTPDLLSASDVKPDIVLPGIRELSSYLETASVDKANER